MVWTRSTSDLGDALKNSEFSLWVDKANTIACIEHNSEPAEIQRYMIRCVFPVKRRLRGDRA